MQKKYAVIDERSPEEISHSLEKYKYQVIKMPVFNKLSAPVSGHPDMLMTVVDKTIYCHKDYFSETKDIFKLFCEEGYTIKADDHLVSFEYPHDISYNCAVFGTKIFALEKSMSPLLRADCQSFGRKVVNVRQGYAKCSTALVGNKGIISADASILKVAEQEGINALRIDEGHINLKGYSHGFIGGATGNDNEKMFFAGDYRTHPDGKRIEGFCRSLRIEPISLCEGMLTDIGTIIFL